MGHQLWRAVIMDMAVVIFWDARIAFCNDGRLRARGGKSQDRPQQIRRSHATIGPKGERFVRNFVQQFHHIGCCDAHHCAPSRIKTHRADPGHICQGKGLSCRAILVTERDGFDPSHICATGFQTLGLFVENFHGHSIGERAHGLHDFAGRPDGACDDDLTTRGIGHFTTNLRRDARQLCGACFSAMKF